MASFFKSGYYLIVFHLIMLVTMPKFSKARENMIDCQIHTAGVVDGPLLRSFGYVPRELFVPERLQGVAYTDENLDIGQGRYLIEPIAHARMLQEAHIGPQDVVLDVASASGYGAAILSPLVTTVIAVEKNKRQIDKASKLWSALSLANVVQIEGDVSQGGPKNSPYSLIVINGAVPRVPEVILEQLDVNGRLVCVIQGAEDVIGQACLFMKNKNGGVSSKSLFEVGLPVLPEFQLEPVFQF